MLKFLIGLFVAAAALASGLALALDDMLALVAGSPLTQSLVNTWGGMQPDGTQLWGGFALAIVGGLALMASGRSLQGR